MSYEHGSRRIVRLRTNCKEVTNMDDVPLCASSIEHVMCRKNDAVGARLQNRRRAMRKRPLKPNCIAQKRQNMVYARLNWLTKMCWERDGWLWKSLLSKTGKPWCAAAWLHNVKKICLRSFLVLGTVSERLYFACILHDSSQNRTKNTLGKSGAPFT